MAPEESLPRRSDSLKAFLVADSKALGEILEFECSCTKTKKVCEHIGKALKEIETIFGKKLFTKNYIEEKTKEAITKYGFTIHDDYNSIYIIWRSKTIPAEDRKENA
jgi:hypothetical protein